MAGEMAPLDFDVTGARKAGYGDDAIADFLAKQADFDLAGARKAGYADSDVIGFLAPPQPKQAEPTPEPPKNDWSLGADVKRGLAQARSDTQALGATVAGARLADIEGAKAKADRGEFLSPIERARADQYDEAKSNTARQLGETVGKSIGYRREAEALPIRPEYAAFKEAAGKGAGEALEAFWKSPGKVLTSMLAEGLAPMVPALGAAAVGGPIGGAAVAGGQTYLQSYAGNVVDQLAKRGVDINDKDAVMAALSNPDIADEIRRTASTQATGPAAAAAVSMGVAGKTLAPAALGPVARQAANIPAQALTQGALQAGGEAAGQALSGQDIEGGKVVSAGIGGAAQGPVDAALFAARQGVGVARGRRSPEQVGRDIMATKSVDEAIAVATEALNEPALHDDVADSNLMNEDRVGIKPEAPAALAETGDQERIVDLFGSLNRGTVERTGDGGYQYRLDDQAIPLKPWDGVQRADTISPALADAQRAHYDQLGAKVVYFEGDSRIPFDGAVDPAQPDVLFLSSNPSRNVAQVGAHEFTHLLESTQLPDGTSLGDLLQQQVRQGITDDGRAYAERLFSRTAPERGAFAEGPEGDARHADAVTGHLIRELGADIGSEAPKFDSFLPRVVDAVETRYGADTARDVLLKLIAGIRQTMTTLRDFFVRPGEGQQTTESQRWVNNLDQIHDTLARMYADRYGRTEGLVGAERTVTGQAEPARPATVEASPAGRPGPVGSTYDDARVRVDTLQRWLGDLDQQRRQQLADSPQAQLYQRTIDGILGKVRGVEDRLTKVASERLAKARGDLDAFLNPEGDSPDMARVRQQLESERQRMADAAAIGTGPSPGMLRAGVDAPPTRPEPLPETPRIQAIPQQAPAPETGRATTRVEIQPASPAVQVEPRPTLATDAARYRDTVPRETLAPTGEFPQLDKTTGAVPLSAEAPLADFQGRLNAATEAVWSDRSIMGRVQRGLPRNEQFAADVARERLMREDAAPLIRHAIDEGGIPEEAFPEIAKLYHQRDGEPVEGAFDRAIDRWVTKREAEGRLIEGDRESFDLLKAMADDAATRDPLMAEHFARLEEQYAGPREQTGVEDVPFGADAADQAPARPGEALTDAEGRPASPEGGGRPGGRGELAVQEDSELGPAYSPRQPFVVDSEALGRTGAGIGDLRLRAHERYRRLVGTEVVNKATGRTIAFDGTGRRKSIVGAGEDLLRLIPALPDLLRVATPIGQAEPDRAGRSDIRAWHKLQADVDLGGKTFGVILTVREMRDGSFHYSINKEDGRGPGGLSASEDSGRPGSSPLERSAREGDDTAPTRGMSAPEGDQLNIVPVDLERKPPVLSPRVTGENPTRAYTPEQREAFANVGRITEPRTLRAMLNDARQDLGKRLVRDVLDPYIGVKARDPEGYLALRNANTTTGADEMFRRWGTLKLDGSAYRVDKQTGGVINDLVKPLRGEAHDFLWWVAAHRSERLMKEDRENLFTPEDIAAMKKLNRGTIDFDYTLSNGKVTRNRESVYLDALRRYDTYNKNALELGVEGGLLKSKDKIDAQIREIEANGDLTPEQKAEKLQPLHGMRRMWDDPFYVPYFRKAEEANSRAFVGPSITDGFVKQTAFKALQGGSEKLNSDLWQNAFGNWSHMIDAALSNRAATKVLDEAVKDGAATELTKTQHNLLGKSEKAEAVWVMKDGEQRFYRVEDPFTLKAITALDYVQSPGIGMAIGRGFKRALQLGVALDPIFLLRNLIRDTENSVGVSRISANVFKNLAQGFQQQDVGNALQNVARAVAGQELQDASLSRETADAIAGGATMRFAAGTDTGFRDTRISTLLDTPERLNAFWNYMGTIGKAYSEAISIGEGVNRLALYKQLTEQGVPHDAASFAARDLQDFTLKGAAPIVRQITELVPFMNAWAQGLYKIGRAASDADRNVPGAVAAGMAKRVALTIGTMALLNLALDGIYADDKDYQNRNEYDRNSNFWFKVGGAEFRIPMGFEVAAMARILAIAVETSYDKNMTVDRARKSVAQIFGTQMAMNPTPQAVKPILDLMTNESRTGSPIESRGMERLRPEQRYTLENTLFARGLSDIVNRGERAVLGEGKQVMGLSPIQVDYLVNAYGGWLATTALGLADNVVRSFTSEPDRPAKDALATATRNMISLTPTSERGSGRYIDMLYKQSEAIEQAANTYRELVKRARPDEAREFLEDNRDLIARHSTFQRVKRLEGDLNEQVRMATNSPSLTAEQKRLQLMRLNAMRNRAAESVFAGASQ